MAAKDRLAEDTEKKITPHLKESISTSQRRTKMEWTPREEVGFPESLRESKEMPVSQLLERFLPGEEKSGNQGNPEDF